MGKIGLKFRMGNFSDRDAIKKACFEAYSSYEATLLPEDWALMKNQLEDEASFTKLFSSAHPFICEHDGKIAGVVFLVPKGNETPLFLSEWSYIRMLGVLPQYRGSGIANALMQNCIDYARKLGEETIALHTAEYQQAWHIYERLGFEKIKDIGPILGKTYWLYLKDLQDNN